MATFSFIACVYVWLNLAFSVALSTVPTLTSLGVTCHNFQNVLYWNYSAPHLKPNFTVTIQGYQSEAKSLYTNQTYLDISKYTLNAGEGYYIQVEAQAEGSENVVSNGTSFSYNKDFSTSIKCSMDFPKLNISVFQRRVKLSFEHPYHVYNIDSLKDQFEFTVYYNKTESFSSCFDDDDVCTVELQLSESLYNKCMNVQIDGSVDGIKANTAQEVCDHEAPDTTDRTVLLVTLLCTGFALLLFIISGVFVFFKLTQADSQTMLDKLRGIERSNPVHVPEQAALSEVTSVDRTALLPTTSQTFSDTSSPALEESSHFPTHFKLSDELDNGEVTEEADSGDFNSGNSLSGYDSQKFPIDMGQGDIVEAYGPR